MARKRRNKTQREQIFSYIARRPKKGATRKELAQNLGILTQSVGPRVVQLLQAGMIEETEDQRDRSRVLVVRD